MQTIINFLQLRFFEKNETWMLIFSLGLLYWLFNPTASMTLIMIVPLLIATMVKNSTGSSLAWY